MLQALSRRQMAQAALLLVVVANAGIFTLLQLDRGSLEEKQAQLATLQREAVTLRGRNSPAVLTRELEDAQAKIAEIALVFPDRVEVIALQDHIVQAAVLNQVQITGLSLQPSATRDLAAGKYPVVMLTVQGQGDLSNLHRFLGQMERNVYDSTTLENIKLTQTEGRWSIQFDMIVFGKP